MLSKPHFCFPSCWLLCLLQGYCGRQEDQGTHSFQSLLVPMSPPLCWHFLWVSSRQGLPPLGSGRSLQQCCNPVGPFPHTSRTDSSRDQELAGHWIPGPQGLTYDSARAESSPRVCFSSVRLPAKYLSFSNLTTFPTVATS